MEGEATLDIKDIFRMLKKRAKLIVGVTLACTVISGALSFFVIKPTYEASTSIIVGKQKDEATKAYTQGDVMMYQQLVKTYAIIAQSDSVAKVVADKAGNKYTTDQIKKMVKVTPQANTQVLEIKVQGKDASEITSMVNDASAAFIDEAKRALPTGGDIQILDEAKVPKNPIKPKKAMNVAIAFLLGLMASTGLAFLLEYMDSTVKSEEQVSAITEFPVIGLIPKFEE